MKKVILLILFCYFQGIGQNWLWLRDLGVTQGCKIRPDSRGGVYANFIINGPQFLEAKLSRIDSSGTTLWVNPWTYNTFDMISLQNNDLVTNIIQTNPVYFPNDTIQPNPTGGYSLVRINENGYLQNYVQFKSGNYILQLQDAGNNNLFIAGTVSDTLNFKGQLILNTGQTQRRFAAICDANFNLLWYRTFEIYSDVPIILKDANNNLIIAGACYDSLKVDQSLSVPVNGYGTDSYVIKMAPSGQILWYKIIKGAKSIKLSVDKFNNVFIGGSFQDSLRVDDGYLYYECNCDINLRQENFALKLNSNGVREWLTHIGKSLARAGLNFQVSPGGSLYFAGETEGTLLVDGVAMTQSWGWQLRMGKLDPSGQLSWTQVPQHYFASSSSIYFNHRNEAFFIGFATFLKLANDSVQAPYAYQAVDFVAKMLLDEQPDGLVHRDINANEVTVYPNPCSGQIIISHKSHLPLNVSIIGTDGKILYNQILQGFENKLPLPTFTKGLYFLKLTDTEGRSVCKQIVIEN
ncbi:MAG: regulatory domain of in-like proprotein convertase [Bacteroidetes bacterium]|nr:regulatory domain of in-like proprotein convertase [Bacteroidota bacterium]